METADRNGSNPKPDGQQTCLKRRFG